MKTRQRLTALAVTVALPLSLATTGSLAHDVMHSPALEHLVPGFTQSSGPKDGRGDDRSKNAHFKQESLQTDATNSDIAFWGKYAFVGNYGGFRVFDVSRAGGEPKLVADVSCPGPQNDVSVWDNLLILSVDAVMAGPNCGDAQLPSVPRPTSGWEGIRVFDVSDPTNPQFVTSVYTDCGSHTNNIIPDPANNRLLVYVLSYALRGGPTCGDTSDPTSPGTPGNGQISIVQVPFDRPDLASVLKTVPIPVSQTFDDLVFLGLGATDGCHDVQFFYELGIAAAACLSVGQMWDITDPANPVITLEFDNDDIEIWHSATFTWDGEIVIFGDESVFGSCQADTDMHGRIWFYHTSNPAAGPINSFLIPRLQPGEYCSAHLFNVLPRNDRYILTSSWYGGGVSVLDFTDVVNNVQEIAHYDGQAPSPASSWSAYWYNGWIYENDIPNGYRRLLLSDSARAKTMKFPYLNPQVQENLLP